MLAGILIIAFSLGLLIYWFRYSCVLILRSRREETAAQIGWRDSRFSFPQVREHLPTASDLDPLKLALDRDYRVLTYLIEHAAGLEMDALEDRLLLLDYRIMQRVYRLTRLAAPESSRRALAEMATVLGILAHRLDAQANVAAEA